MSFDIVTADIGSVIFQIFIIWLVSSFFSKKKKNKNKTTTNKDFFSRSLKNLGESVAVKKDDDLQFLRKNDANQNDKKVKYNKPKVNNLKNKLGLNSKASIKNAIVISEILNKPLSQRR